MCRKDRLPWALASSLQARIHNPMVDIKTMSSTRSRVPGCSQNFSGNVIFTPESRKSLSFNNPFPDVPGRSRDDSGNKNRSRNFFVPGNKSGFGACKSLKSLKNPFPRSRVPGRSRKNFGNAKSLILNDKKIGIFVPAVPIYTTYIYIRVYETPKYIRERERFREHPSNPNPTNHPTLEMT